MKKVCNMDSSTTKPRARISPTRPFRFRNARIGVLGYCLAQPSSRGDDGSHHTCFKTTSPSVCGPNAHPQVISYGRGRLYWLCRHDLYFVPASIDVVSVWGFCQETATTILVGFISRLSALFTAATTSATPTRDPNPSNNPSHRPAWLVSLGRLY